jgi:hypothetical protein
VPFFVGSRDACRLAGRAVTLVAGAWTAFAFPAYAWLWPHFAYLAAAVFLAALSLPLMVFPMSRAPFT